MGLKEIDMKRFEVWAPTLAVLVCVTSAIIAIIHGSWICTVAFAAVGVVFGLHLGRELRGVATEVDRISFEVAMKVGLPFGLASAALSWWLNR